MITKLLLTILLLAAPLDAQTYVLVVATDSVREYLAGEWDPTGVERAYCGTAHLSIARDGEPLLVLTAAEQATQRNATTESVTFSCPRGQVPIHSHPGNICGPSLQDLRFLRKTKALFGITICDRYAYAGFSSKLAWPEP